MTTRTTVWNRLGSPLRRERLVAHNVIVGGGTVVTGLLGVAFQSLFSHRLQPTDYGAVFAVITLITFIGLPATGFTLVMAWQTSRDRAAGEDAASATLLRRGNRALVIAGAGLGAGILVVSPALAGLLNIPTQMLIAAAAGLPFALALPFLLGEFQGQQHFLTFSAFMISQAALKLIGAFALGFIWGPTGIIAGVSLASAVVYFTALVVLRKRVTREPVVDWWRPAMAYLAVIIPSTLALAVLLSADVLLVKHYFPTGAAGVFAVVAALGRAIFWGASGVAAVLFPKVIFRRSQGHSGLHLVSASLALVAIGGVVGLGLLSLAAPWLVTAFAGSAYTEAARYLPWYAVGMTLFGGAAVLVATHQSRGTPGFLLILIPLTLIEPTALFAFHHTLSEVVLVVDVCMALLLTGLAGLYLVQERFVGAGPRSAPELTATSAAAPVGANR